MRNRQKVYTSPIFCHFHQENRIIGMYFYLRTKLP